jgi:hypothetical protein
MAISIIAWWFSYSSNQQPLAASTAAAAAVHDIRTSMNNDHTCTLKKKRFKTSMSHLMIHCKRA